MATLIPSPSSQADFTANVQVARAIVGQKLGLPLVEGTADEYRALNQADQVRLADELSAFIVAQPVYFSAAQVALAQKRVDSPGFRTPLADTSLAASAGQFVEELAGRAEAKFTFLAAIGITAAVIAWVLPGAIARITKK